MMLAAWIVLQSWGGWLQVWFHNEAFFTLGIWLLLQEMRGLQSQSGGDVNVEVNTTPDSNLMQKLNEMRCEYEQIIENNRKEVERWYETKVNCSIDI